MVDRYTLFGLVCITALGITGIFVMDYVSNGQRTRVERIMAIAVECSKLEIVCVIEEKKDEQGTKGK